MSMDEFLKQLGCDDEVIQKLKDEKIECSTILLMADDELKSFFPKYGDRIAIKDFCKKKSGGIKLSLIEKIKSKLKKSEQSDTEKHGASNKRSLKSTRVIEIGWMCCEGNDDKYRQVRTQLGGGTRKISVSKFATCKDVMDRAIELFFPKGSSPKGGINEFNIKLLDYKNHDCDMGLTVQQMYDISALSTLRFYLGTALKKGKKRNKRDEDVDWLETTPRRQSLSSTITRPPEEEWNPEGLLDSLCAETTNMRQNREELFGDQAAAPKHSLLATITHPVDCDTDLVPTASSSVNNICTTRQRPTNSSLRNYITQFRVEESLLLEDVFDESFINVKEECHMVLRRGHIFQDLLQAFEENFFDKGNFKIEMILPSGEREAAADYGGVWRDALSEFWKEFYDTCTVGTVLKVPCIRHDFGAKQWKAIAKILYLGFTMENYFPIQIAPVFVKTCLFKNIGDDELKTNFFSFVCETDRHVLQKAETNFDKENLEEIIDVFASYDAKWAPNENNIKQLIRDIAHQELIQKPAFIIKCIQEELYEKMPVFEGVLDVYKSLEPSVHNCLAKLSLHKPETITAEQTTIYNYLKKFIKEIDIATRESLFRFCTGSNLPIMVISVDFSETTGARRLPIAHTCSGLLQLSSKYESYVVFRNELKSVLSSNIWVMDIV